VGNDDVIRNGIIEYLLCVLASEGKGEKYLDYKKKYFQSLKNSVLLDLYCKVRAGKRPREVFGEKLF